MRKGTISTEKMRNSGNNNCNYAHSFFGEAFNSNRYTGYIYDYAHSFFGKVPLNLKQSS